MIASPSPVNASARGRLRKDVGAQAARLRRGGLTMVLGMAPARAARWQDQATQVFQLEMSHAVQGPD